MKFTEKSKKNLKIQVAVVGLSADHAKHLGKSLKLTILRALADSLMDWRISDHGFLRSFVLKLTYNPSVRIVIPQKRKQTNLRRRLRRTRWKRDSWIPVSEEMDFDEMD